MDSLGRPGWDRVDALAKALIKLDGLCATNAQANEIIHLYDRLLNWYLRTSASDSGTRLGHNPQYGISLEAYQAIRAAVAEEVAMKRLLFKRSTRII